VRTHTQFGSEDKAAERGEVANGQHKIGKNEFSPGFKQEPEAYAA